MLEMSLAVGAVRELSPALIGPVSSRGLFDISPKAKQFVCVVVV